MAIGWTRAPAVDEFDLLEMAIELVIQRYRRPWPRYLEHSSDAANRLLHVGPHQFRRQLQHAIARTLKPAVRCRELQQSKRQGLARGARLGREAACASAASSQLPPEF
jgi:hypothetical protein